MAAGSPEPSALYARVLDGRHLWLAVHDATQLRLGGIDVAAEVQDDLLVGVVNLDDVLGDLDEVPLTADGRPVRSAPPVPGGRESPTRDDVGYEVVDVAGAVVVRRLAPPRGVEVRRIEADGHVVHVHLGVPAARVEVVQNGAAVGELPVTAGVVDIDDVPGLASGATVTLRVPGSGPVVRARNVLRRPNFAVLLPPLAHGLELRWQPNGRLALHRR